MALFSLVEANEEPIVKQDLICQQIMEEEPSAILFCTENKIYLHHEKIQVSSAGLFVGNVHIPRLFSDSTGCWLQKPNSYWICRTPSCSNYQKVYHNPSGKCPQCHLEGDPG